MKATNQEAKKVGGLRISVVNWGMLGITCVLAVCLFFVSWYVEREYDQAMQSANDYIRLEEQADIVHEASEYLTSEVRLFVVTTDRRHTELYFEESNVIQRREAALEELSRQEHVSYEDVRKAVEGSKALMEREIYAMKLVAVACSYDLDTLPTEIQEIPLHMEDAALESEAMLDKARTLVFDADYQRAKDEIYADLNQFTLDVLTKTKQKLDTGQADLIRAVSSQRVLLCVLVILVTLHAAAIVFLVAKPLRAYLNCIRKQSMLRASGAYEFQYLAQVYNEIYTQKEASVAKEAVLKHKAEHDLMTGLQNRISAEEQVRMLMEEPESQGILILLDLDDLKGINDTLGHAYGDKAIIGIADTLKGHFRDSDVLGRLGGDEFLVYLPGAAKNRETIALSLVSLLKKISEISIGADDERQVHCSIGCAVQTESDNTYELLFKQADTALYHVKRSSKNNFAFFEPAMLKDSYHFKVKQIQPILSQAAKEKELQHLLKLVAIHYPGVVLFNLTRNYFRILAAGRNVENVHAPNKVEVFWENWRKNVHPDDQANTISAMSRTSLLDLYARGQRGIRHYYRNLGANGYIKTEVDAQLYTTDEGDICAFLFFCGEAPAEKDLFL